MSKCVYTSSYFTVMRQRYVEPGKEMKKEWMKNVYLIVSERWIRMHIQSCSGRGFSLPCCQPWWLVVDISISFLNENYSLSSSFPLPFPSFSLDQQGPHRGIRRIVHEYHSSALIPSQWGTSFCNLLISFSLSSSQIGEFNDSLEKLYYFFHKNFLIRLTKRSSLRLR